MVTPITISKKDEEELQQWSASYTLAVRQHTEHQEPTIKNLETLPYNVKK